MTIETRLAEMRERCKAATEGPWRRTADRRGVDTATLERIGICDDVGDYFAAKDFPANMDLIAHARTDLPALLGALEEIWAACDATVSQGLDEKYMEEVGEIKIRKIRAIIEKHLGGEL